MLVQVRRLHCAMRDCCDVIPLPCVPPTRRAGCVAVVRGAAGYLLVLRSEYGRCFCQQHNVQGNVTQHANFLNFALGQRWEVGREAKCNVCWPVAGTLHLGTPETYRCVQLRLYTCECNYMWRNALAEFTSQCLMFCVGSSSSRVPEVADFG